MLLREPIRESGIERQCDLMLIIRVGKQCGFFGIGKETTFCHNHRMFAEPTEK